MMNDSRCMRTCYREGEESLGCDLHIYKKVWRRQFQLTMANDSTKSMRNGAMSDVYIVLFTFVTHF